MSAPFKFTSQGVKAYQGRLRWRYAKVYPVEDDMLKLSFKDTKDDVLLVGKYQVLAFDLLDELAPQTPQIGKDWTLCDVDLDEAKGWYIHGTNGTVVPTKDEFVHVLATLQMILIRTDFYPSIFTKNNSNYDDLGLQINYQSPYEYANDQDEGLNHTKTFKMGLDGKPHSYGNAPDTIGTFEEGLRDWTMVKPAALGAKGMGLWKVAEDPTKLGRRQVHGEIIAIKEVELFENINPLTQAFLNDKVEGRLGCAVDPLLGEYCWKQPDVKEQPPVPPLPPASFDIPSAYSQYH